jgi:hypothetical protein
MTNNFKVKVGERVLILDLDTDRKGRESCTEGWEHPSVGWDLEAYNNLLLPDGSKIVSQNIGNITVYSVVFTNKRFVLSDNSKEFGEEQQPVAVLVESAISSEMDEWHYVED